MGNFKFKMTQLSQLLQETVKEIQFLMKMSIIKCSLLWEILSQL